ncbi:MAG: hypothetical protein P4M00_01980 [Azospirillaceae bacterium]|nr:hypothetical protein [Azospirillaceae bacterium]
MRFAPTSVISVLSTESQSMMPQAAPVVPVGWGARPRWPFMLSCAIYAILCAMIFWMVGDALRENDQAAYLRGAFLLAKSQASPFMADFYDYDKKFASYWLLALVIRICGFAKIALWSNLSQAIGFCLAEGAVLWRARRQNRMLLPLLPLALSPVVAISAPFFANGMISLIFLVAGFAIFRRGQRWRQVACVLLVLVAASCRVDVVLAVPTLLLTQHSRRRFVQWLRAPFPWMMGAAALIPLVAGRFLVPVPSPNAYAMPFHPEAMALFILFGVGAAAMFLFFWCCGYFATVAWIKRRWLWSYIALALAPLLPFLYYIAQFSTPVYSLLSLACCLFLVSDRRFPLAFRWLTARTRRVIEVAIVVVTVVPWGIGLRLPRLAQPALTWGTGQAFPTAKGHFPMGGYLHYVRSLRPDHFMIDHNQALFRAAQAVSYQSCGSEVPVLATPMREYLELAVTLQGLSPRLIEGIGDAACGFAYADARSLVRADNADPVDPAYRLAASLAALRSGQAIVRVGTTPTAFGALLDALQTAFAGREFTFSIEPAPVRLGEKRLTAGRGLLFALDASRCSITPDLSDLAGGTGGWHEPVHLWMVRSEAKGADSNVFTLTCPRGTLAGWAIQTLPDYMAR